MSNSSGLAVTVDSVDKSFDRVQALNGLSFTVPEGSVLGLLGPNGAGKTTTVRILCTLTKPDSGTVTVAGVDVVKHPSEVRRLITMTGQFAALDISLTARQNLRLFGRLMGLSRKAARIRAEELIEEFDLVDAASRPIVTFSGGMKRRADLAAALVVKPKVVFLDEPTTGLDPRSRQKVWSLVEDLKAQGVTVVLTTQYLEEADQLADQVVVIDHGRVIANGTADELKTRVGGSYCEIVPASPDRLPDVLGALDGLVPAEIRAAITPEQDRISIPAVDGPETLTEVVRRLDSARIPLADIALRRPTLDDVFLNLTGHDA